MLVTCAMAQACILHQLKQFLSLGKAKRLMLTKVLASASMKSFVSDLGLAPLTR